MAKKKKEGLFGEVGLAADVTEIAGATPDEVIVDELTEDISASIPIVSVELKLERADSLLRKLRPIIASRQDLTAEMEEYLALKTV